MPTLAENSLANSAFIDLLDGSHLEKQALDLVNDYTRLKMREDGIFGRVLPKIKISNSDLDRQVTTSLPAKVVDMEVDSPAAISVPLATMPQQYYIHGQRYLVVFNRILSPWFQADVDELRTHVMDIRQVMSDNATKDMLAEEDAALFSGVNNILVGANQVVPFSGIAQWQTLPGSISRSSLVDAKKIMTMTGGHLVPEKMVVNSTTWMEICKLGREEIGGDMSEKLFKDGWTDDRFFQMELLQTIKRNLVPDNSIYLFAGEKWMGKFYELEESTMFIERRAYFLSYFMYMLEGATFANPYAFVRVDFQA